MIKHAIFSLLLAGSVFAQTISNRPFNPAIPGAIGATTPATVAATTLSTSSNTVSSLALGSGSNSVVGITFQGARGSMGYDGAQTFIRGGAGKGVQIVVADNVTGMFITAAADIQISKTITAAGTTGARTINGASGSVNFAAAATSLVVTNSLAIAPTSGATGSIINCTVNSNDSTMKSVQAVCKTNGSFTLYPDVAPTAETRVSFFITN